LTSAQPRTKRPLFTIERLRTLVLVGGGVLVVAIVIFLAAGQWKRRFFTKDLPKRLGIDIQQQANGVDYTQSRKGKTLFKIHAARYEQLKKNGKVLLHDVRIDLYGEDGNRTDTISGSEFAYDVNAGVAQAAGAVEITLMRPGVKPAIADLRPGVKIPPAAANQITDNEIHAKTSGLVFNQKTGVATTSQRMDFALRQGSGTSIGATYDSAKSQLILDRAVELHIDRSGSPVTVHASHAEFERSRQVCQMISAQAEYSGGSVEIGDALIYFRDDGSVIRVDGSGGVRLKNTKGGQLAGPIGSLEFNTTNHPRSGVLRGGTQMNLMQPDRTISGTSPMVRLAFDGEGDLHQAHMENGVSFVSEQQIPSPNGAKGGERHIRRTWKSQTADIAFAAAPGPKTDAEAKGGKLQSRVEPRTIHGFGGVSLASETTSHGITLPSKLTADTVVAELDSNGSLSSLVGTGHSTFDQRTAAGVHQASSSDQLDVRFMPNSSPKAPSPKASAGGAIQLEADSEIASVLQTGHVVLTQDSPPAKSTGQAQQTASIRATADRADYDGQSQLLHLSGTPRIRDGSLDLAANTIDFARASGDAFAHGAVKASWTGKEGGQQAAPGLSLLSSGSNPGANGPVLAVAAEAEMHQSTQEVIFRGPAAHAESSHAGDLPRLWQGANSISAPTITLNRKKQTLVAESGGAASPVRTVLINNRPKSNGARPHNAALGTTAKSNSGAPSVIRLTSGDLHYSEGERLAVLKSGAVGSVTAQTSDPGGTAIVTSQEADVNLMPAGVHSASPNGNTSVDKLTAHGRVTVTWPDRKGTGEKLIYLSEDATFTLTGTSTAPPRITDQARGTVTGAALIFHTRDDSVTVEGDGAKTVTEARSPK